MRKFTITLFILLCFITTTALAESIVLNQGIYKIRDLKLMPGVEYSVRNASVEGKSIFILFDTNNLMQQFIRLEANSSSYTIKALDYDSIIVIIGEGNIVLS